MYCKKCWSLPPYASLRIFLWTPRSNSGGGDIGRGGERERLLLSIQVLCERGCDFSLALIEHTFFKQKHGVTKNDETVIEVFYLDGCSFISTDRVLALKIFSGSVQ
jgi:hypothetical protein